MELEQKLENLKKQHQQLEVTLIKVQGAMELIEAMIAEEAAPKKEEKVANEKK